MSICTRCHVISLNSRPVNASLASRINASLASRRPRARMGSTPMHTVTRGRAAGEVPLDKG
ncbi:unnamed protein product [Chondrus crispus]|uniref:Uncharacterized protein n=1 Tax=Chondrus crispus TaxID=2769 RepID=R7Q874_CHOCR|nr:unnamed protein product [Chondrus crispus]CDF33978.1 unnamed protein product [Chondrus crispus]|eukprot:XP_005713797.1 unnamed protein product [Chondrus crispus]